MLCVAKIEPAKYRHGMRRIKSHNFEFWGVDVRHHFESGKNLEAEIFVCMNVHPTEVGTEHWCGRERARFIQ